MVTTRLVLILDKYGIRLNNPTAKSTEELFEEFLKVS